MSGEAHAAGRVYLVPNLLGVVPPAEVLPLRTIHIARALTNWLVETPKPARAFLASLDPPASIASLSIVAIGDAQDAGSADRLLAPALRGEDVGILSDAGCPGVADPGARIVAAAHARGLRVVPLVGPSSVLLALMAAGMNGQRFAFHGYVPVKAGIARPRCAASRPDPAWSAARSFSSRRPTGTSRCCRRASPRLLPGPGFASPWISPFRPSR